MSIYITHKGSKSGPFEDDWVIEQLENGRVSPDDMAMREGDAEWQPLSKMFPNVSAVPGAPSRESAPNVVAASGKGSGCTSLIGMFIVAVLLAILVAGATGFALFR